MADVNDRVDVERFMRSEIGQKVLAQTRKVFQGRWISGISFAASMEGVKATITFHAGDPVDVTLPGLTLGRIREEYAKVLEEEYCRDFPEQRPMKEEDSHGGAA